MRKKMALSVVIVCLIVAVAGTPAAADLWSTATQIEQTVFQVADPVAIKRPH